MHRKFQEDSPLTYLDFLVDVLDNCMESGQPEHRSLIFFDDICSCVECLIVRVFNCYGVICPFFRQCFVVKTPGTEWKMFAVGGC